MLLFVLVVWEYLIICHWIDNFLFAHFSEHLESGKQIAVGTGQFENLESG